MSVDSKSQSDRLFARAIKGLRVVDRGNDSFVVGRCAVSLVVFGSAAALNEKVHSLKNLGAGDKRGSPVQIVGALVTETESCGSASHPSK